MDMGDCIWVASGFFWEREEDLLVNGDPHPRYGAEERTIDIVFVYIWL